MSPRIRRKMFAKIYKHNTAHRRHTFQRPPPLSLWPPNFCLVFAHTFSLRTVLVFILNNDHAYSICKFKGVKYTNVFPESDIGVSINQQNNTIKTTSENCRHQWCPPIRISSIKTHSKISQISDRVCATVAYCVMNCFPISLKI